MGLILFLIFIFLLLGVLFFLSMSQIVISNEEDIIISQLLEESKRLKDNNNLREIYNQNKYVNEEYNINLQEGKLTVLSKKDSNRKVMEFNIEDILELNKKYNGSRIDVPGYDYVWSEYGLNIKYLDGIVEKEKTLWFNKANENKFSIVNNVENSIIIDAIIYNVSKNKQKN